MTLNEGFWIHMKLPSESRKGWRNHRIDGEVLTIHDVLILLFPRRMSKVSVFVVLILLFFHRRSICFFCYFLVQERYLSLYLELICGSFSIFFLTFSGPDERSLQIFY